MQSSIFSLLKEPKRIFRPRPYQTECVEAVRKAWSDGKRSTMAILATGLGKTFIAGSLAAMETGRVLFLVDKDALAEQAVDKLCQYTGREWQREQAEFKADTFGRANVVGSVQTLIKRKERLGPNAFSLVIVDEAHHYASASYRQVVEYFEAPRRLGITATPDRKDGAGYSGLFDDIAYRMELGPAIEQGWSVPFDVRVFKSDIDLSAVRWERGDFVAGILDEEIARCAAPIVEAALTQCDDLRTVIYTPGVASCIAVADTLNKRRPDCARAVYGELPKGLKRGEMGITAQHRAGRFQYLVNCFVVAEGYDDECIQCIIDAAPTSSRSRAVQKWGRGSRLWPGVGDILHKDDRIREISSSPKPNCRLIDLAFNFNPKKLAMIVSPADLLSDNLPPAVRKRAAKLLSTKGGDASEAIKRARQEVERRQARAAAAAAAKVRLTATQIPERTTSAGELALTPGQERQLSHYKIPYSAETTKRQASKLIGFEKLCEKHGWIRYEQRAFLEKWVGMSEVSVRGMSHDNYRRVIDTWKLNGKIMLSGPQIRALKDTLNRKSVATASSTTFTTTPTKSSVANAPSVMRFSTASESATDARNPTQSSATE